MLALSGAIKNFRGSYSLLGSCELSVEQI